MQQELEDPADNIRMLVESASAVVPVDGSLDRVRAVRFQTPGFSRDIWATLADMGWLGLRVGEAVGGLALGVREAIALSRVLGGGLVPEPYLGSLFALALLEKAGLGAEIGSVLAGGTIVLPAWQGRANAMNPLAGVEVSGGRLYGTKIAVGTGADQFAVTTPGGLVLVPCDAEGLTINQVAMHDGTFRATLTFEAVACDIHSCDPIDPILSEAMLIHAGYLQGAAEQAFDITLEYLRTRQQFGVAIGSFQALQHRATEIKVQLELTRAAIDAAATMMDHGGQPDQIRMNVLRARARSGSLARLVARETVQMHGAIGYTDEADIGLFVRKLMVEAGQFAPEYRLRSQFMDLREAAA